MMTQGQVRDGPHSVLGVEARVDDAVHVEVEVVKLDALGVGTRGVHGDGHAVDLLGVLLDDIHNDLGVPVAKGRGHTSQLEREVTEKGRFQG